jgi:excinuclease ABC subunit A
VLFSERMVFPRSHDIGLEALEPRLFSFNAPWGACPECTGLGSRMEADPGLVVPDAEKSLSEGFVAPWTNTGGAGYFTRLLEAVAAAAGFSTVVPWRQLPAAAKKVVLHGFREQVHLTCRNRFGRERSHLTRFEGVLPHVTRRHSQEDASRERFAGYVREVPCPACGGARLKPAVLAVTVGGRTIAELTALPIDQLARFFRDLELAGWERRVADAVVTEIGERLRFLLDVGLDHLSPNRSAASLSGGEAQRIRLATQIDTGPVGVLYVLDEPSVGLRLRDNRRLLETLVRLRDRGNTVLVVEHDEETVKVADRVVDIGPGAGAHDGHVVHLGTVRELLGHPTSLTGAHLSGRRRIPPPEARRPRTQGRAITVHDAGEHNLREVSVSFPLDQSPIGRSPRSNPATYTGVFDHLRKLFARTPEAKAGGYRPGRFSFNLKGGRCEHCDGDGDGTIKVEMNFLPDVYVPCEVCHGARYNRETLDVHFKGRSIADVLGMTIEDSLDFFAEHAIISRHLRALHDVGLGYVKLGQPATTLSGGEARRVKLASELQKRTKGRTFYVLDEPTTGLHVDDVRQLLAVLHRVDQGNTVVVIEHDLDVIKTADWIVDMGPEGGHRGGTVIAEGTPEQVAAQPRSYTGQFLRPLLERS